MQLALSRSTIRSFHPTDAASLAWHIGTDKIARNMSTIPNPYSLEHADRWIATATSRDPQTHFAIAIDDKVVGGIGFEIGDAGHLAVSAHCAEVGYWLGEAYWGRGIMTEVLVALTEWAFEELRLIRLHAAVYAYNPASARVLEKAGYECEGRMRARYRRDGELIDGLLYAKVCPVARGRHQSETIDRLTPRN